MAGVPVRSVHRYGDDGSHVAELFLPDGGVRGVAVVIHGGFWRAAYDRHLMDDLCADLAGGGWAAWNVEYRRTAGGGGGWPATFADVAAAVDHLAAPAVSEQVSLGHGPVVSIGHSAGGQLALWAAARPQLPAGAPGAGPAVRVTGAVSQAGVVDLHEAARLRLSSGAAQQLLGEPPGADPERWRLASPAALVPLGVPQLLVHGEEDDAVPAAMSRDYGRSARAAGDAVDTVILPGVGHFEHLDPRSTAWQSVRAWLAIKLPEVA